MKVSDFQEKTETELLSLAEECFIAMDEAGWESKAAFLLQAQLYMNQASRLNDARVAERDFQMAKRSFNMEIWVIVLIGIEIVLSVIGIGLGIKEGNKQLEILGKLNTSASDTAAASRVQAEALPKLVDEQKKSLSSLIDLNGKLQGSLQKTADMSTAMQEQLKILQEEQASRRAELAKKPRLELYVGDVLLNSITNVPLPFRESTATKTTFNISLRNSGTASATKGTLRVIALANHVTLECSAPFQRLFEAEAEGPQHVILISFDYDRPQGFLPMSITATYPAGQAPFVIIFNVDADEIPVGTPLGSITLRPPKP